MKKLVWVALVAMMGLTGFSARAQMMIDTWAFSTGVDTTLWMDLGSDYTTLIATTMGSSQNYGSSGLRDIGFSFTLGATTHTKFSTNINGTVRLGTAQMPSSGYIAEPLGQNINAGPRIDAFGRAAMFDPDCYMRSAVLGDSGSRVLVVETRLRDYGNWGAPTGNELYVTFQVQLFEAGGLRIVYGEADSGAIYGDMQNGVAATGNSSNKDVLFIDFAAQRAVRFNGNCSLRNAAEDYPVKGRWYALVPDPSVCPLPSTVTPIATNAAAVLLPRTAGDSSAYRVVLPVIGVDTVWPAGQDTFALPPLNPATTYSLQLQTLCGSDTSYRWRSFDFFTGCGAVRHLPWGTDFASLPYSDCWEMPYESNTEDFNRRWRHTSTSSHVWSASATGTYNSWLKLPVVYLPAADGNTLRWDYRSSQATGGICPHVELRVAPCDADGEVANDSAWVTLTTLIGRYTDYKTFYANLDAWRGQRVRVAFVRTGEYVGTAYIDNVMLYQQLEPLFEWTTPSMAYVGDTATFEVHLLAGVDSNVTYTWHSSLLDSTITLNSTLLTLNYTIGGWDTVTLVASNVYGNVSQTAVVDVLDCGTVATFPWTDDFSHNSACWTINGWGKAGGNSVGGYDESGTHTSFTNVYYSNEVGGYMITQPIAIPATGAEHLALWVQADGPLMVRVSTTVDSLDTAYFTDTLLTVPDNTDRKEIWWRTANISAYAGQTVRFGFFRLAGTQPFLSAVRVDYDTLPVLSLVTAPAKTRTDSTITCSAQLLRGASDGLTITWHSSLMDTSWVDNEVNGFAVYYSIGGVDTITVIASNAFGSDTAMCTVQVVDCNPVTSLPWHEGFENGIDCWYRTQSKTYHQWNHSYLNYYYYQYDYIYNYCVASQCNFSESDTMAADAWLVSRAIDIPADTALNVCLFWSVGISSGNNLTNVYRIMVTTSSDFADTTAYSMLYCDTTPLPNKSNMAQRSVSLADYAGQTVYIAFRNQPVVRRSTALIVDDVEVRATVMPRVAVTADAPEYYYGDTATFTATLIEGSTNGLTYTWHSTLLDTTIVAGDTLRLDYGLVNGQDTVTVIATNAFGSDTALVMLFSYIITQPYVMDFTAEEMEFFVNEDKAEVGDTVVYVIERNPCVTTGLTYHLHSSLLDTTVNMASTERTCHIPLAYPVAGTDSLTVFITNSFDTSNTYTLRLAVSDCPAVGVPFFEDFDNMGEAYGDMPCWPGYYWLSPIGGDNNLGAGFRGVGTHPYLITPAIDLPADTVGLLLSWYTRFSSNYHTNLPARVLVSPTGGKHIADFTDTLYFGNVPLEAYDTLSLDSYLGQRIRIAFGFTNYSLCFDDIRVDYDRSAPQVTLATPSTVYTHDSIPFTATLASGSPQGLGYTWHSTLLDSTIVTIEPIVTIVYSAEGTDTLTVVAANAYGSDTATLVVAVVDHPLPEVTLAAPGTAEMGDTVSYSATLNNCSQNGLTITWHSTLLDSTIVTIEPIVTIAYPFAGIDTVTVTVSNLYGAASDTALVQVFDCSGVSVPYTEDFEGVVATASNVQGSLPGCWQYSWNGSNAAYAPHVIPSNGYQYISNLPSQALFMVAGSSTGYGNRAEVILPRMADSLQTLSIAFDYRFENTNNGTLTVGYYSGNTFTALQTMTPQGSSYRRDTVSLAAASPDGRLALRWYYGSSWYAVAIDNIKVFHDNAPHAPASVTVDSIGITYARVNWTPGVNATAYRVVVDGVVDTIVNGLSVALDGLAARTQYTVSVAGIAGGDTSGYVTTQFITLCGPVTVPYYNDFSQGNASIDCWTQHNINVYMTDGCMAASSGLLARPSYICTPVMNHPGNGMVVNFRLRKSTSMQDSVVLVVGAMTDPADTTTFTAIDTFVVYGGWINCRFSTRTLGTAPVAVAFCVGTGNDVFSSVKIDDLAIEEPIACTQLISAEATTLGPTSAMLSWQYDTFGVLTPQAVLITLCDLADSSTTTFTAHGTDTILTGLPLAHTFRADLRVLCDIDTSEAVSVSFAPEASACAELAGDNQYAYCYPLEADRAWGYCQMVYPAALAATVDTLYGIALYYSGTTGPGVIRTLDVYIGQTTANSLTSPISVSTHTLAVQNHQFAPTSHGWIKIPFTTPVPLNGTENLVVTIDDNTGTNGYNQMVFRGHNSEVGGLLYYDEFFSSAVNVDPANVTVSLNSGNTIPDIQLLGNCSAVDTVTPIQPIPPCPPVSIPYAYDFTTGATGCWTVPGGVTSATSYDDGGARMDEGHEGHRVPIVSPEMDRNLAGHVVRYTVSGDRFFAPMIYIGVSDADGQNAIWLDSTIAAEGTHEYIYYFDTLAGSRHHIIFFGEFITHLLNMSVDTLGSCMPVSQMEVTHLADTAATLQWSPAEWPSQWAVYLNGVLQGTTTDSLFHFGGLQPETKYIASVRAICSAGDTSVARSIRFTTICPPQTLPYSMDFENEYRLDSICWHTTLYPYNNYPSVYINGTTSRTLYILMSTGGSGSGIYDPNYINFVTTPLIDPQGQGVDINFRAALWSLDSSSFMEVGIMADVADTAGFIPLGTVTPSYSNSTYIDHHFNVSSTILPQPFCLAFRFGGTLVRCYLDDVSITAVVLVMHDLTLSVNDTAMGTVSGAGSYEEGTDVTIAAVPNVGYRFDYWSDGDTNAIRSVKMDFDIALTAYFAPDTVWHTVIINPVMIDGSYESQIADMVSGAGTYADGDLVTLEGEENGCSLSFAFWVTAEGDTLYDNPYTFTITSDVTVTAVFAWFGGIGGVESGKTKVEIYPNPATTDVTLRVGEPSTFTVIDMSGRVVIPATQINSTYLIPHSTLPSGVYFVRVSTSAGMAIVKLIMK